MIQNLFERVEKTYKKNKVIEYGIFERGKGKGLTTNNKSWTYWKGRKEFFFDGYSTGRSFNSELKKLEEQFEQ